MKRISSLFACSMVVLLFSCSNGPAKEEPKTVDSTIAVVNPPADAKPVFIPFKIVTALYHVKNFEKWEAGYFANDSIRKAYTITNWEIGRDLRDSNLVYTFAKMEDLEKVKTFSTLPSLKEEMKKHGISSVPGISYAEVIRSADAPVESANRVAVAHHVKDFAAWLKVYDAEGPATRSANGLVDRQLARSLQDSNMVFITFAVTDMAKAKARFASAELNKIMTDAGVDSPPTTRWFRIVK